MSTYRLSHLFQPRSVAIVGASDRPGSLGRVVLENVRGAGFTGEIYAINPKRGTLGGSRCWSRLTDLPLSPDVMIVATPPNSALGVIDDAVRAGVKSAVILTAGLGKGPDSISQAVHEVARRAGLRIVGPNCLGVLAPQAALNASFATRSPKAGHVALVSQSGAVAAGVIEWSAERNIGFSGIVSLGDAIDVDFGDCLDYFAEDPATHAILLYVEAITDACKFMSAARAAARVKPVVVIKAGRHAQAAKAATTHTGALAGVDEVYDAAFRRAGLVRALDLDDLFSAAETLSRQKPFAGDRLAVLTNGGGLGVLAVDRLIDFGGRLADLSPETLAKLDRVLPPTWSRSNPVDIIGDAPPLRYTEALEAILDDPESDAVLVMNCPTGVAPSRESADAVIQSIRRRRANGSLLRPIFSVWLGGDQTQRAAFEIAGVPAYRTETDAIRGFMHLVQYRRRIDEITRTPDAVTIAAPDRTLASAAIRSALQAKRRWLNPVETANLLAAYGIPGVPVHLAANSEEAAIAAGPYIAAGQSCVIKIHSPDIVHKSEVNGVRLDLSTREAVVAAANDVIAQANRLKPNARIMGVTVQPMIARLLARELIAGVASDSTFGAVIAFGQGGTAVEVVKDSAIDLLPIDIAQARALVTRTRVSRMLDGYRNVPAADRDALALTLVRLSRLTEDLPEIIGIDLNPILADESGVLVVDARIEVRERGQRSSFADWRRFAVRPYPREWERDCVIADGRKLRIRPIRPDDETALQSMLSQTSAADLRLRFHGAARSLDHTFIARLTQIDYSRAMAFVAVEPLVRAIIGVARLHGDANHDTAEFAILVRTDNQRRGLGWLLMNSIIEFAKAEGFREIKGHILAENSSMLQMCSQLGFNLDSLQEDASVKVARLRLQIHELDGAARMQAPKCSAP